MKKFIPKMYQKNIYTINYPKLKEKRIKLLIFDLDNTIGTVHEDVMNKRTVDFLNKLASDFIIVIASNSKEERVKKFCSPVNFYYVSLSLKPTSKSFMKIKKKYHIAYQEMAMIGDQIITDIFGANCLNIYTILVDPINKDLKITSLNRKLEEIINKKNKLIRGNYYEEK